MGEQYRSVIFYLDESQKKTAEEVIAEWTREKVFTSRLSRRWNRRRRFGRPRIITRIIMQEQS